MSDKISHSPSDEDLAVAEANKRIVNYGLVALLILILGFMGWGFLQLVLLILRS